ncbi:hypothetical protein VitviT2T_011580 [Vitis vinifera]|uniref:Reverse transcriptase domain-containing protein n=1 Tax=Vitis vinifera TaxID=29760 RepID=A0ABY9CC85_VITVI|nr:hypothetical protein VitviT2T_011580 [Vitis vinifera]
MDAVLIANEIVDERRRSGEEGVIFKIDFEKAYDHVRWDFLDQVLEKKGFSPRWRKWMSGCLSSVSYAVLVNGSAKGWVKASRGLRQGDPLSSFLFTLVADVLSRMLLRAEERNMLEGFRVGRNRTRVSHLQFADDTIFFSNTREEDLQTLKSLLLAFGHISGLKVNLDKSNIYGINLDQAHISRLAETLECKASGWPILYLGLPLGGNPRAGGFWDPVIERISRRLDGWQKAYLSFGGRITLIQSCLTHMPCYFLSLFKLPASIAAKIERLQRDFLWSGIGEGKKDHLVRWDVMCKPKEIGGLGFGNISLRNLALLGKWLWRYPREGSALWHQVILSIYGSHSNGWDANTIERWSHRCPWKAISQVFQEFSSFTRFVVGNGERIRFWEDLWLFQLAKMDWVPPRSILDMMYIKFNGFGSSKRGIALWQAANIALIRIVWRERNARIFEDKARNSEFLWDSIVFFASLWAYCSKVFKGTLLNALHLDWIAAFVYIGCTNGHTPVAEEKENVVVSATQANYGGYMVAFAGRKYAARSSLAFVSNSTYTVTSFTLVLEFKKGRLQNLYWKRDGCSACSGDNKFVCLNNQDCAIKTTDCKGQGQGASVDCSLGIQLAFSGTDKHYSVLNSWYEVKNLRQYSLYGLYANLADSLTSQYNKIF